jgi:hypothetical protein
VETPGRAALAAALVAAALGVAAVVWGENGLLSRALLVPIVVTWLLALFATGALQADDRGRTALPH